MLLSRVKGAWKVIAEAYTLTFAPDRPFVYVQDTHDRRLAELFVLSSVHPLQGRDDTTCLRPWTFQQSPQEICFSMSVDSSCWREKTYRFRCSPRRFVYEVEVEGEGQLFDVNYFGGYSSALLRWGSGFFWSGQKFKQGFNCEPNALEINQFTPAEGSGIGLMGVPLPGKSDWFFTPPPFCFGFKGEEGWLGVGVEAAPGQNNYTEYRYNGGRECFYLSLDFEGHQRVAGRSTLPAIGFDFAEDEYAILAAHVAALQSNGDVPVLEPHAKPAWWYEPIFCGWGAQAYLAEAARGKAPGYSRQQLYERFLKTLDDRQVNPGIVVLDDKWQASYGENRADENKWPDLRAFVDQQHARGRKVLLWLKAWDPEGIPVEECITNARGAALAVDPTNPKLVHRLRESVRMLLSAEGMNADGFKIDFTARIPSGPAIRAYGEAWGLELMKLYLQIIYTEAKKTKPDALIMAHTPHPYLADVLDMIRLNDINIDKDVITAMTLRNRVARIACPQAIIDTDNWPIKDRATWREYLRLQPQLGVPSLYFASHIDTTQEPLGAQDYELIRQVWDQYRESLRASGSDLQANKSAQNGKKRLQSKSRRSLRLRRKPALRSA
jgi:hypothetical protein